MIMKAYQCCSIQIPQPGVARLREMPHRCIQNNIGNTQREKSLQSSAMERLDASLSNFHTLHPFLKRIHDVSILKILFLVMFNDSIRIYVSCSHDRLDKRTYISRCEGIDLCYRLLCQPTVISINLSPSRVVPSFLG